MPKRKRPRGRPEKAAGEVRSKALTVRLTPTEHSEVARLAALAGRSVSNYLVVSALHPGRG